MVNRGPSDAAPLQTPAAPVVKRKRRASCLGEQERRERKRAIDREAQRSLREKTKTHIAELERTIQILRDQDRNGATANLLSEIEDLRKENDRLRDVIESVRSVVGGGLLSRNSALTHTGNSSAASSVEQRSPKRRATSIQDDNKPSTQALLPKPSGIEPVAATTRSLDLDGMTMMADVTSSTAPDQAIQTDLNLKPLAECQEEEFFGPDWRCPSPVVLHIGNPGSSVFLSPNDKCPTWNKANELYGNVFKYRPGTGTLTTLEEAGLLYSGIKHGWNMLSDDCTQSPALVIQKQVDVSLFHHLPKMNRLAIAYKSFKLLKYYLKATKEELDKVPKWLQPSHGQSATKHPVAIDFFAWPSLRDRLIAYQETFFQDSEFSRCYVDYVQFDWPFPFEDAFFQDEATGTYYPSPLFERYHNDLQYWTVDPKFSEKFPEVVGDIDVDRRRFAEVEGDAR
ncbi:hypothetical protein LEMA_P113520.1 [Plenodomus lingam JN3]|uniref:BZIP transcription factor n=1 Tax=Leptosphaeria maculans (strain JN3 / isolate v23.1.3 / race Av1-4-5-6-7-8) TaxID=985895 RepID=E4ZU58_LEPMJ|nr:hypothetical protein LEMA_P113520.1 [Plenodomus lingam JN3]CBX94937.1 hypothetical protein LEMA_P113520.1 [Plenodomus lingam JN3]